MHNVAYKENTKQNKVISPAVLNINETDISQLNTTLESKSITERVEWAMENLPGTHIVSSSFGAQSAVMLHLLNQVAPGISVVLTDTGYLFPETYQFIDQLSEQLNLNLKVYRADITPAWQEARYGKLWENGIKGIEKYNQINKVTPMKAALNELNAKTWFAGLRRSQSGSRKNLDILQIQAQQFKVHPIVDLNNQQLHRYMTLNNLPYHPLWEHGYVSIGDWHTTRKLEAGMNEEDTRFFGLKRECGLHEFGDGDGI
ncbi:phosphoadenylyl-sulfate reductase [Glaciecola petra]|uniref:Phosphoadenosine 5'-phosphosulfate reductase n=1 Tax=Glaciecola petra TaxID=3075602 RepID=A0ABU2ZY59_9ALTE|nr:phosphoadenylyl-sulfate reductase [Aestuariibacter sp. P117]MDT0596524.1 phosphoadenylyl-sulfate reductase [Aestuariibacter sp. P117]